MGGSLKAYRSDVKNDEISHVRYKDALEIERSNRANELAKKAEKLRLIYKTRFEEDLRAFMVSKTGHDTCLNSHVFKCSSPKPLKAGNVHSHKFGITSKFTQSNSEVQKPSFIPTWAWPASLRNSEDVRLVSLFYTAETNVPLSPSQVGGNYNNKLNQIRNLTKQDFSNDKKNSFKALKICKKDDPEKLNNQNVFEPNNLKQIQRQKLRSKYGAPFTWVQNRSKDNTEMISSPLESSSDISTPQSQVFTEIPKQPSIYPLELERDIAANSNLGVSEFIKKSLKMQKALELLLEHSTENNIKKKYS
ncbi:uncharacterized protein ELE39_000361 [Cryptosporidium sp. chipmunk genotype I]|uniref:uncharacterized protein n=1 Tax=Cryptosporidium sp. chipmunk genotype I TaxID=1280935 RepID=UPI003519EDD4|nr:hypothetical protein ELE39_000361 [Cryptosporidium sp. chipmunk genotype I]